MKREIDKYVHEKEIKVRYRKTEEGQYKSSKSFDMIIVRIPIISHGKSREELLQILNSDKKYVDELAIKSIKESSRFKRSGLTMNYFELDSLTLNPQTEVQYIFGIKKSILKLLND